MEVARIRKEVKYITKSCLILSKKYGSIVGLKLGSDRIVVLNDLESIQAMLNDENCDGRPTGPLYQIRTFGRRQGNCSFCEREIERGEIGLSASRSIDE